MSKPFLPLVFSLVFGLVLASKIEAADSAASIDDSARQFVKLHPGIEQFPFFSRDIVEAYPTGRSNAANDDLLKKIPVLTTDWDIDPNDYKYAVIEGDHFSVEWFFRSKWKTNGTVQCETTLAFGIVKAGKLVSWTEFYDDSVGEMQHDGKIGTYSRTDAPFPWPPKPGRHRAYRTYDGDSATWKNYPDLKRQMP
jgi:hypothetical protein